MTDSLTMTMVDWQQRVDEVNESARDDASPDWVVSHVPDAPGAEQWLWHIALPLGSLVETDPAQQYVVHHGAERSREAADRRVQCCIDQYDAKILGRDPNDSQLRAARNALLTVATLLFTVYAVAEVGLPPAALWWLTAALLVGAGRIEYVRSRRAFDFIVDR